MSTLCLRCVAWLWGIVFVWFRQTEPTPEQIHPFVPWRVGDRVRCMRLFNSTCGQVGVITKTFDTPDVEFRLDGRNGTYHRRGCVPGDFEAEHAPERDPNVSREVMRMLREAILVKPEIHAGTWDLVHMVVTLGYETSVHKNQLIRTLCIMVEREEIPPPKTTYWGYSYWQESTQKRTPRELRVRHKLYKKIMG